MSDKPRNGPSIIHAGLMRTGTYSMTKAYEALGLRAHHALDFWQDERHWEQVEAAAAATFPAENDISPAPPRFTRADWDGLFGEFDVVTDIASLFAPELLRTAYPDARVVIVQRDFEPWWASMRSVVVAPNFSTLAKWLDPVVMWVLALRSHPALVKLLRGAWSGANDLDAFDKDARRVYDEYYEGIRKAVPAERRLDFKLSDGWGPLCEFLGKEVPNVPFPRVNDTASHDAFIKQQALERMSVVAKRRTRWMLGPLAAVGVAVWLWRGVS